MYLFCSSIILRLASNSSSLEDEVVCEDGGGEIGEELVEMAMGSLSGGGVSKFSGTPGQSYKGIRQVP